MLQHVSGTPETRFSSNLQLCTRWVTHKLRSYRQSNRVADDASLVHINIVTATSILYVG